MLEVQVAFNSTDFDATGTPVDRGEKEQSYTQATFGPNSETSTSDFIVWYDEIIQNTTSVLSTDNFSKQTFSVYPNPSTLAINIRGEVTDSVAQIYSITGSLVSTKAITGNFNSVDVSTLKSGMYFLKLESGASFKFVKK